MTINEFMKKAGVSKKKYVESWIECNLIPGISKDDETGEWIFPDSARRPYRPRCSANASASTIRASILKACLKREHISKETYHMSEGEFLRFIEELVNADLISVRIEDGITYYDSTIKSDTYKNKSVKELKKVILQCIGIVVEKTSYGTTKAIMDHSLSA